MKPRTKLVARVARPPPAAPDPRLPRLPAPRPSIPVTRFTRPDAAPGVERPPPRRLPARRARILVAIRVSPSLGGVLSGATTREGDGHAGVSLAPHDPVGGARHGATDPDGRDGTHHPCGMDRR